MTSALFLLSPFEATLLDPRTGMQAARALKEQGMQRADVGTHPRFSYASPPMVHKNYAVADFTLSARMLTNYIFRPVVGRSDVCDLSHAPQSPVMPQLGSLATVGALFAQKAKLPGSACMDIHDGGDLGLVFFLAIHGRPQEAKHYDLLLFPGISRRARQALETLADCNGPAIDAYGVAIDLNAMRRRMAGLVGKQTAAARVLN